MRTPTGGFIGRFRAFAGSWRTFLPAALFLSNVPAFGMAVTLLVLFAVKMKIAPISGGYNFDMIPNFCNGMSWL